MTRLLKRTTTEAHAPGRPSSFTLLTDILCSRFFVWGCLALVGACVLFARMYPIDNPDFGWHVALGRYIFENRTVPLTETFSHTAFGKPMVAHEWLSELLYYVVFRAGGVLGLRWLHAGLTVLVLGIVYGLLRRQSVAHGLAMLGSFLYFVVAHSRFHPRPHMFDILFLVCAYGYLFVLKPVLSGRQLLGVFAFVIVWANFHSGVVRFAVLVLLYVGVEALQQIAGWRRPVPGDLAGGSLRRLGALAVLVVTALTLTPNHFRLFPYIVASRQLNAIWSVEWRSIIGVRGTPLLGPLAVPTYWLLVILTGVIAAATMRRRSMSGLAVVAFLTMLPLWGIRFVDGTFAPIFLVMDQCQRWLQSVDSRKAGRGRLTLGRAVLAAAPLLTLIAVYPVLGRELLESGVSLRAPDGRVLDAAHVQDTLRRVTTRLRSEDDWIQEDNPVDAMTFLDEVSLEGRLYNPARWGGYILFRTYTKYPVFIDGRWADYGEDVFLASLAIEYHRDNAFPLLDQSGVDILLVPRPWMSQGSSGTGPWIPVFENHVASIFIRNTPANRANLNACAAYYRQRQIPFDPARGFDAVRAVQANPVWARQMGVEGS